jgi:transcriptional regulator with XRE-family HTH domain
MSIETQDLAHSPASLRALREFTKDRLCREAEIGFETLIAIEAGETSVRMAAVEAVARVLGVSLTVYVAAMERERARRGGAGSAA